MLGRGENGAWGCETRLRWPGDRGHGATVPVDRRVDPARWRTSARERRRGAAAGTAHRGRRDPASWVGSRPIDGRASGPVGRLAELRIALRVAHRDAFFDGVPERARWHIGSLPFGSLIACGPFAPRCWPHLAAVAWQAEPDCRGIDDATPWPHTRGNAASCTRPDACYKTAPNSPLQVCHLGGPSNGSASSPSPSGWSSWLGVSTLFHRLAQGYVVFAPGSAPLITADSACKGNGQLVLPDGTPCALIQVPSSLASKLTGQLFMVDVSVYDPATSFQYVESKLGVLGHLHRGEQMLPAGEYTNGQSSAQTACSDVAEMFGAQEAAPVAALRRLGYQVKETDHGAVIGLVVVGSPAANAGLCANETITAINGSPVHTAGDMVNQIRRHKVGDVISVTTSTGAPDGNTTVKVKLAPTPAADAAKAKEPVSTPFLGIGDYMTNVDYSLPFNVTINAGDIGGPSAGLAFTLGIIDLISGGNLTGSAKVAATGVIEADGTVGPIGGVAQKAVAVGKAGATVFLVPQANYADAKAAADSHLRVEGVSNLSQALADLSALGGTVPPSDYAASHPYTSQPTTSQPTTSHPSTSPAASSAVS